MGPQTRLGIQGQGKELDVAVEKTAIMHVLESIQDP